MIKLRNITLVGTSLAISLALGACNSAPSEGELKGAVEAKMKADSETLERSIGKQAMPTKPELKNVRKIDCKSDSEKAYRCEVELEVNQGGTLAKGTASMRFVKSGENWVAGK